MSAVFVPCLHFCWSHAVARSTPVVCGRCFSSSAFFTSALSANLRKNGLNLIESVDLTKYNKLPKIKAKGLGIPVPESFVNCDDISQVTAVLIGNNREVWPHFVAELKRQFAVTGNICDNPFDTFVFATIRQCTAEALSQLKRRNEAHASDSSKRSAVGSVEMASDIRFYNELAAHRLASFRSLAHVCEMASLNGASQLCVDRTTYGPWLAFRALVIADIGCDAVGAVRSSLAGDCEDASEESVLQLDDALESEISQLFADALNASKGRHSDAWCKWLRVRDTIGRSNSRWNAQRYCDDQILYHYTKDKSILFSLAKTAIKPKF